MTKHLVYMHKNKINGKAYIGFTSRTIKKRWYEHTRDARLNNGNCRKFHNALRKYGDKCWESILLFSSIDIAETLKAEERLIVEHDTIKNGYNITPGGTKGTSGYKFPPEFGAKISARQAGENNHRYGILVTESERVSQSKRMKKWHELNEHPRAGAKASIETKKKMSDSKVGERNHFYGKKHTREQKESFSKNNPMNGKWGWMNPCTAKNNNAMLLYSMACEFYEWWLVNKKGADVMCRHFGQQRKRPHINMINKFNGGWNPGKDNEWVACFG